jgi:DNA-binding SARP family transcriptional activator
MEFRILGPLEVFDRDGPVGLGGDKQRALLAILLLHANEVVSTDRLIEDLWGERPPATSLRTLQAYVSRLRKALDTNGGGSLDDNGDPSSGGSGGVLVTRGHGYLLRVAPGELDLDRFRGLVEGGRRALAAGETATAARILREGLAMWRGPTRRLRRRRSRSWKSSTSVPSRSARKRIWRSDATATSSAS